MGIDFTSRLERSLSEVVRIPIFIVCTIEQVLCSDRSKLLIHGNYRSRKSFSYSGLIR